MRRIGSIAAGALVASLLAGPGAAAERHTAIIAAGEVTGFYYPAAGAVCRVVNKERPRGLTCAVMPSSGSAANIAALRSGEADLAVVQLRAAHLAQLGEEGFKEAGPFPELRALMALHGEAAAVLVRPDAGVGGIADLKGKRVNLGRSGSFQRSMAETVLDAAGLSQGDLAVVVELDLGEQGRELCDGNIDAALFAGVQPMPEVEAAMEECGAVLVPVKGKAVDAFLKKTPWLARLAIKGGTYEGQKDEVATIGIRAVLAASTRLSAEEAYDVVRSVYANFGSFGRLHPVLKGLSKGEVARDGTLLKLHEGADRFYGEAGLK